MVALNDTCQKEVERIFEKINSGSVKVKECRSTLFTFALKNLTETQIKKYRLEQLKGTQKKDILFEIFRSENLGLSRDDYENFTMDITKWSAFVKKHHHQRSK